MYKESSFFQDCIVTINENLTNGYMAKEHWHGYAEILYVLEGEANQVIDGHSVNLVENDIIYLPSGVVHSTYSTSTKCRILVVLCDEQFIKCDSYKSFMHITGDNVYSAELYYLFDKALFEYTYKNTNYIDVIRGSLISAFTYMCRISNSKGTLVNKASTIKDIFVYIENNLEKNLTVLGVARHFGYTPEHFTKIISSSAGVSFKPYVDNARITVAIRLLIFEGFSVNQTAQQLGYDEVTSFYRTFKRVTGLSPTQYTKRHRILNEF